MANLAIIDLALYLEDPTSPLAVEECKKAAEALISQSALIVKSPTAHNEEINSKFLDLFEDYFNQPLDILQKDEETKPGYQRRTTLAGKESPKCGNPNETRCQKVIQGLAEDQRPIRIPDQDFFDPKCRFYHKIQQKPPYPTDFPILPATPLKDANWQTQLDRFGGMMISTVELLCEMLEVGLGLEKGAFKDKGTYGPHLLAPTATDLTLYGKEVGTIFAGFHTDLNFITIHGKSRYPGLNIWARNSGTRISVKVPDGCFLVQAGKQIEILTGGLIMAGYHEVICTPETKVAMESRSHLNRPLIRISSTLFWHLSSDVWLEPIPALAAQGQKEREARREEEWVPELVGDDGKTFKPLKVGNQVLHELGLINLES